MPIPMEPAANFAAKLASGELVRYGAILKDAGTGHIVGHLKEVGELSSLMSEIGVSPFAPLNMMNPLNLLAGVGNLGVNVANTSKLNALQATLETMELATNAAALASVSNLGVSVSGFAVINEKLNRIESRLDDAVAGIERIQHVLENMQIQWDAMSLARLKTAAEQLIKAENSSSKERRLALASKAADEFTLLKNYYAQMLSAEGLFSDPAVSLDQIYDLLARYNFCCIGLLHAEFLIGDKGAYRSAILSVTQEYQQIAVFSAKQVYLSRCDQLGPLAIDCDFQQLSRELTSLSSYSRESLARIESFTVELDYIESNRLDFVDYRAELSNADLGLMVLPAKVPRVGQRLARHLGFK